MNIDLLKYDSHTAAKKFSDSLSSSMILPYILYPARKIHHSKTLFDVFSSNIY